MLKVLFDPVERFLIKKTKLIALKREESSAGITSDDSFDPN